MTTKYASNILDNLPRGNVDDIVRQGVPAMVCINDAGVLLISIDGEGILGLEEDDQYLLDSYEPD